MRNGDGMMLALALVAVLLVNYGIEVWRLQTIYEERRPKDPLSLNPRTELLAGRSPIPAGASAIRRIFQASEDEAIEKQRRITIVSFMAWLVAGVVLFSQPLILDRPIDVAAEFAPFAVVIPLTFVVVSSICAWVFVREAVGPRRRLRLAAFALVAMISGCLLYALVPTLMA